MQDAVLGRVMVMLSMYMPPARRRPSMLCSLQHHRALKGYTYYF